MFLIETTHPAEWLFRHRKRETVPLVLGLATETHPHTDG